MATPHALLVQTPQLNGFSHSVRESSKEYQQDPRKGIPFQITDDWRTFNTQNMRMKHLCTEFGIEHCRSGVQGSIPPAVGDADVVAMFANWKQVQLKIYGVTMRLMLGAVAVAGSGGACAASTSMSPARGRSRERIRTTLRVAASSFPLGRLSAWSKEG